jgi:hypothetical protein
LTCTLAHLLDEADAGVDEERDSADDAREYVVVLGRTRLHGIEERERRDEGERQLLRRGRPGLLEVIAADVRGVPFG